MVERNECSSLEDHLRRLRSRKGWTQEHLGKLVGVSRTSVKYWETGTTNPTEKTLKRLVEVYLDADGFTSGKEWEEVVALWESAQLKTPFDEEWFAEIDRKRVSPVAVSPVLVSTEGDKQQLEKSRQQTPDRDALADTSANEQVRQITLPVRPADQSRQRMLQRAHIKVKRALEESLHGIAVISLGLREMPDAVTNPWRLVFQEGYPPAYPLASATTIAQVYDDSHGELLILGEPGSGKTTLLLQLARVLLERARDDDMHPIPVIFNLASWAKLRLPLARWLVEELHKKYQLSRKLAQEWVNDDRLLLLLDGFDEVDATYREACLQALNEYRQEHGLVPIVVCTREDEYLTLNKRLILYTAVTIQPLTMQDIDEYLVQAGERLAAMRVAFSHDPTLYELVRTPLMLSVLTLTYQYSTLEEDAIPESLEERRRWLFDAYVQRMLHRRQNAKRYTPDRTKLWLSQLAHHMRRGKQVAFYIEDMQADWLPKGRLEQVYECLGIQLPAIFVGILVNLVINNMFGMSDLVDTVLYALISGCIGYMLCSKPATPPSLETWSKASLWRRLRTRGIAVGLILAMGVGGSFRLFLGTLPEYGVDAWLHDWLVYGTGFGLCGVLLGTLQVGKHDESYYPTGDVPLSSLWRRCLTRGNLKNSMLIGCCIGLASGLGDILASAPLRHHVNPLIDGIGDTACFSFTTLFIILLLMALRRDIRPAESIRWSWSTLRNVKHLRNSLLFGLLVAAALGSAYGVNYGIGLGCTIGSIFGSGAGLSYWLLMGSVSGISSMMLEFNERTMVNVGIRVSARNSLLSGLISASVTGLTCFLVIMLTFHLIPAQDIPVSPGLPVGPPTALLFAVIVGASVGLLTAMLSGGSACVRHTILRCLLWYAKITPWNYPQFLEFAADHVLLQREGGAYTFIHGLLLDRFAELYNSV